MRGGARARRVGAILAGVVALVAGVAGEARPQSGLPLPPGVVLTGPVFKQPGQCPPGSVPSITTGADANAYICSVPPTASFVPTAPAAMVVTSAPTQYVRVYCPECSPASFPNRSFMADPSTIRGLTPAQIKDVLALPSTPTMITIVTVPSGSCVLVAQGAAIPGFGSGGTAQAYAAGTPSGPNCQGLQFLPASDYINQQAIGAFALAYQPRAGSGNAGAVAAALDRGPYAAPFTDMDGIYKSLDLLNFGDSAPLRAALVQLDGEVYADVSTVAMGAGQLFLGAVRERARAATKVTGQVQQWLSVFGGAGDLSGNGDSHNVRSRTAGLVGGLEHQFDPSLQAGIAFGYAGTGFNTSGVSGSGTVDTLAVTPYARYAPGRWYVEGAIGAAYSDASITRDIVFPGVARSATGNFGGTTFLSQVETGYRLDLDARTVVKPFVAVQGIAIRQGAFTEVGAGAANLNVARNTTGSALGILGAEVVYGLPVGLAAPARLNGRLGWARELAGTQRIASAFLDGTPGASFTVNGANAPRDAAVFGLGMTLALRSFDLFVRYEGTAGSGATMQGGTGGLRFLF